MGVTADREKPRYFSLISKAADVDRVNGRVIAESVKVGDKQYERAWVPGLSGFITKAEIKDFEWEGKTQKKFSLHLQDQTGLYQLEFTCNNASYGIINCLLTADLTQEITIEGWISKSGFVNAGAKYTGQRDPIKWEIPLPEVPRAIKYKTPGGEDATDSTNVKAFWLEEFKKVIFKAVHTNYPKALRELEAEKSDINPKEPVKSYQGYVPEAPKKDNSWPTTPPPPGEDDSDDMLPF